LPIVLPTFSFDTRGAKEKGIEKTPTSILRSAERKLLKQLDQNFEKKKAKIKQTILFWRKFIMELAIGIILGCCALGAGICMGIGAIGPGIGEGNAVSKACEAIGRQPESKSAVTSTMIMGCAIAETTGIYSLVIAILLIFVAPNIMVNVLKSAIGL
jgi:F-type H+-transporting ATPase subunit c